MKNQTAEPKRLHWLVSSKRAGMFRIGGLQYVVTCNSIAVEKVNDSYPRSNSSNNATS